MSVKSVLISTIVVLTVVSQTIASPWASQVVSYAPGSNITAGYDQADAVLGEPTRSYYDAQWSMGGDVTPFNAPYMADQVACIGAGGELIVAFDHPVADDPANPFGIDLLVFGNAFYYDANYPNGIAGGLSAEPAKIAVSQDGNSWVEIAGVLADGLYPTLGYTDSSSAFAYDGTTQTDFTKPVNPAFDPAGKSFSEIVAGYSGSGGGTGVDLTGTGLDWIQYVKVYQNATDGYAAEIDGFADVTAVPEPMSLLAMLLGIPAIIGRKK